MYAVSERFLAALRSSHTVVSRVDLMRQGELIEADIPVLGGEVTDDSSATIRRRATITLAPAAEVLSLLPSSPPSEGGLWPLGNELLLRGGIRFDDGTEELASLGLFRISRPSLLTSQGSLSITLEGYDRGRSVSRARFVEPYEIASGVNYSEAIKDLIKSRVPWMTDADFDFMETDYTTPSLVFTMDDDPWAVAQKMASSFGAELFFDGDGKCVMRPEPDPLYTPSVFEYAEGEEATITSLGRSLDDEGAYNGVIVTGENTDLPEPVRAEAWDDNPQSPTFYDPDSPETSIYGAVPYFITSQYITTESQAQDAANANLARVMGVIEQIDFAAVNNPAHTSGDVIDVVRANVGVSGTYILDSVTIGLGHAFEMSGVTRRRRAS